MSVFLGCLTTVFFRETILIARNSSRPHSFVINDFNNDYHADIGVANSGTDSIGIFLGYSHNSFASEVVFSTVDNSSPYSIAAGDLNNDTFVDVVVANSKSNNMGVFLGFDNGSFAKQITYPTDDQSRTVVVEDLNNDNILDIIVANYGSNDVGVFLGHADGTFAEMIFIPLEYGSHPFFVLDGNFNNDEKLDLAVANNGTDSLHIPLQTC